MRISDWSSDVCSSDLFDRLHIAGQDRHAVEALLAMPDCPIAKFGKLVGRKAVILALDFLQTGDCGLRFGQPFPEPGQPRLDTVYVEGGDLHAALVPQTATKV